MTGHLAPQLEGAAREAVEHRDGHLQIIAAAGSGKTEVVSQRVASLLADGESAESIVAFTFTERAAEELVNRISRRVEQRLGRAALDPRAPVALAPACWSSISSVPEMASAPTEVSGQAG